MTRLRVAMAVLFLAAGSLPLTAQAKELTYDHRVSGDRAISVIMGPVLPQAFQSFGGTFASTNLYPVGGTLGLDLDFYLDDHWSLGAGLRGNATFSPNSNTLFLVPVTFRATYEFKWFPFSFPVGLGTGVCFTSYLQSTNVDFILMPSAGAFWNVSSSWSVGLQVTQWMVFEPYSGGNVPASEGRIAYFIDPSLAAIYHF